MTLIGIGYRHALRKWIDEHSDRIECLEITAEHFFDQSGDQLRTLSKQWPLYVHGLGLSLGTPGALDQEILDQFHRVAEDSQAEWVSEHLAFTRSREIDLGHLNPLPRTKQNLNILSEHVRQITEFCGRPLLLENITSYLNPGGDIDEPDFLNRLCEQSGCGLLLDATNLFINSKNHRFDASQWLHEIHPKNIVQLHVIGYDFRNGVYQDHHRTPIQDDLFDLIAGIIDYADVKAIILERDQNLNRTDEIEADLARLKDLVIR